MLPTAEEWALWKPYSPPAAPDLYRQGEEAHGVPSTAPTAVDAANAGAVVKPTAQHTAGGTSAQTRYPFDRQKERIYEVHTSPE